MIKYIALASNIIEKRNELFYELFEYNNVNDFKLFLYLVSKATIIAKINLKEKKMSLDKESNFELDSDIFTSEFLSNSSVSHKYIEKFIKNTESKYFKSISIKNKKVFFELSKKYISELKGSKSYSFDFEEIKDIKRNVRAAKLKFLVCLYKKSGFFHSNFLFKVLDLNSINLKKNKIKKIREAFKEINIEYNYNSAVNHHDKKNNENYGKFEYIVKEQEIEVKQETSSESSNESIYKDNNKTIEINLYKKNEKVEEEHVFDLTYLNIINGIR